MHCLSQHVYYVLASYPQVVPGVFLTLLKMQQQQIRTLFITFMSISANADVLLQP